MAISDFSINSPDLERLIKKFKYVGANLMKTLERGTKKGLIPMERLLKGSYLSGAILKARTGHLRSQSRSWTERTGNAIFGFLGAKVKYASPHEFGFKGVVDVRAHFRHVRGKTVEVSAHSKYLNLRERAPFRKAIRDRKNQFLKILMLELRKELKKKRR
jgi:hypothetical protein